MKTHHSYHFEYRKGCVMCEGEKTKFEVEKQNNEISQSESPHKKTCNEERKKSAFISAILAATGGC